MLSYYSGFIICLYVKRVLVDVVFCFRYGESFPVSAEVLDSSFCLPIGKAKVIDETNHN